MPSALRVQWARDWPHEGLAFQRYIGLTRALDLCYCDAIKSYHFSYSSLFTIYSINLLQMSLEQTITLSVCMILCNQLKLLNEHTFCD